MLGCDPEFAYVNSQLQGVNAQSITGVGPRNGGRYGYDGRNGEVRPAAARNAMDLCDNIHDILFDINRRLGNVYGAQAGSFNTDTGMCIGGHIHFDGSLPTQGEWDERMALLDIGLALPLSLVENQTQRVSRLQRYGQLSDWRPQAWGPEYRTTPSWLVSRAWAERVLAVANAIWGAKLKLSNTDWRNVNSTWTRGTQSNRLSQFETLTLPIWKALREQGLISQEHLRPWLYCIEKGKMWNCGKEIMAVWGVANALDSTVYLDRASTKKLERSAKKVMESVRPAFPVCLYSTPEGVDGVVIEGPMRKIKTGVSVGAARAQMALVGAMRRYWKSVSKTDVTFAGIGPTQVERKIEQVFQGLGG